MNTAKTLQLLDANNNNISPAVCVDSLYFEKTESGTTYRMSLKNRMLVAGSVITTNLSPTGSQLQDIAVPMFTISKVSGSADVSLYQLNCSTYNIGSYINNAINASLANTYYSKTQSSSIFVKIDGTNCVSTGLYVGASGQNGVDFKNPKNSALHLIAEGNTSSGLDWNIGVDYFYVDTAHNADIYTGNSINMKSNVINLGVPGISPTTYVNINSTNNVVDVSSKTFKVYANSSINLNTSGYGSIHTGSQFDINVDNGALNLYSERGNINLNTNSSDGYVRIYGRDFTKPSLKIVDDDAMAVLVTSKNGTTYDWTQLPILQVTSKEALSSNSSVVYQSKNNFTRNSSIILKDILFYGDNAHFRPFMKDSSTTLVDYNNSLSSNIAFKGINSGGFYTTLLSNDTTKKCIQIATINKQSLVRDINSVAEFNYDVLVSNDISTFATLNPINAGDSTKSFRIWGSSGTDFNNLKNAKNCSVGAIESVYFKSSGAMYAQSFYASSDERLKTEIQTIEIENDVPDIKKFVWKDSSTISYGFIAQELEKAGYPEIVSEDDNGFKKVDYNAALSLKIASIQKENEELKNKILDLETIVSEILTKVNKI